MAAPQPFFKLEAPLVDPESGILALPWQYLFLWIYSQLGGTTGQSATGLFVPAPVHNTSPGRPGQIAYDGSFLYVCITDNSWARVAIGGVW